MASGRRTCLKLCEVPIFLLGEFFVATIFDDDALLEHDDAVTFFDCAKPMRDHNAGSPLHRLVQCFLYDFLALLI